MERSKQSALLVQDDESELEIFGYEKSLIRWLLSWLAIVCSVGFLKLIFYWRPQWLLYMSHKTCDISAASVLLIKDKYGQQHVRRIQIITRDGTRVKPLKGDGGGGSLQGRLSRLTGSSSVPSSRSCLIESQRRDTTLYRFFTFKKMRYFWNSISEEFELLRGLEDGVPCSFFHTCYGLSEEQEYKRRMMYGPNKIIVKITPIIVLIVKEILTPFYIFQIFSIALWYSDEYEFYASCIVLISLLGIVSAVYQTRKMQRALRNTVEASEKVNVSRSNDRYEEIFSHDLVPGDVIEITSSGCTMSCDAVLITGNVVVNESMLTGESVPVTKTPLPNPLHTKDHLDNTFLLKEHSRHILFCGTNVIQTRYYGGHKVKAVVIRTGFGTAKGCLVRSILYPKALDFQFQRHTYRFIQVLACVALVGMVFTLYIKIKRGMEWGEIVKRALDLVTITVPPALPAALTIGSVFAQRRLKNALIFCISPSNITVCGSLNAVCFDKTGTLTEDGLDMWGVVPTHGDIFLPAIRDLSTSSTPIGLALGRGRMLEAMTSCHSLTIIEGKMMGDPLDLKMFESTGWILTEARVEDSTNFDLTSVVRPPTPDLIRDSQQPDATPNPYEVGIVRQFPFSSSLQRMSVIARVLGETTFNLYAKGAPEMIASLSKPESVPLNFHTVLMHYTQQGYRVIALAWRPLHKLSYIKAQKISRSHVECELTFLGLLVMENRLKPETTAVIRELTDANIRTLMITGDNMLTGLSVARNCSIIGKEVKVIVVQAFAPSASDQQASLEFMYADDINKEVEEISCSKSSTQESDVVMDMGGSSASVGAGNSYVMAISGKVWDVVRQWYPELIPKLAVRAAVCARFSPDQKKQMVEELQQLGYYVGMCGDGANDCGALKTAHAGISLSEAEASVASPFTSKTPTIECVPTVIKEGRASLVTAFAIFKYMACYSLTQFISVLLLYWVNSNLSDWQFLYIDMFIITTLSITFSWTSAWNELSVVPPPVSLVTLVPLLSLAVQMLFVLVVQVTVFLFVQHKPQYMYDAVGLNITSSHLCGYKEPSSLATSRNYSLLTNITVTTPAVAHEEEEERYDIAENYAVFTVSAFQYIILAIAFARGPPFRKPLYTNPWFMVNLFLLMCATLWLVSGFPFLWPYLVKDVFEMCLPQNVEFRLSLLLLSLIQLIISVISEKYILDGKKCNERIREVGERCCAAAGGGDKGNEYHKIEQEIENSQPKWPHVIEGAVANLALFESVPVAAAMGANGVSSHEVALDEKASMEGGGELTGSVPTLATEASFQTARTSVYPNLNSTSGGGDDDKSNNSSNIQPPHGGAGERRSAFQNLGNDLDSKPKLDNKLIYNKSLGAPNNSLGVDVVPSDRPVSAPAFALTPPVRSGSAVRPPVPEPTSFAAQLLGYRHIVAEHPHPDPVGNDPVATSAAIPPASEFGDSASGKGQPEVNNESSL